MERSRRGAEMKMVKRMPRRGPIFDGLLVAIGFLLLWQMMARLWVLGGIITANVMHLRVRFSLPLVQAILIPLD